MKVLVVIPARMGSTRLPGKMMADIHGKPLIVRTYEQAIKAQVGDVIVACDSVEIQNVIQQAGGTAILTDPALQSGTDRVFAAWKQINKPYDCILNVQGDQPLVDPEFIQSAAEMMANGSYDISTLATPIHDDSYKIESVVKPVISFTSEDSGQALYFSRAAIPFGGPYYHHVGIYGFAADALEKFVSLSPSKLELTEKLEQLRALENGMTIGIQVLQKDSPISVDTAADLEKALAAYSA